MSDRYQSLANSPVGKKVFSAISLPIPVVLERHNPDQNSFIKGQVVLGATRGASALPAILGTLQLAPEAALHTLGGSAGGPVVEAAGEQASVPVRTLTVTPEDQTRFKGLVFDATGIRESADLHELWAFFHPLVRKMESCGRILVIGRTPETCEPAQHTAQRALVGLVKALGKEIRKGTAVNLVYVSEGGEDQLAGALQFFLSAKSAYVSGQVVRVAPAGFDGKDFDWQRPLHGKNILVTGAARGIGAAIASTLARDGATVIALDIPPMAEDLRRVASDIGGIPLEADITAADTPAAISKVAKERGGLHAIIHNAGITRDKTMGGMPDRFWDMVIDINISAAERINAQLLADGAINKGGRIVGVSSISGIAGNMGQTNYATSKAAVIGMVESMAPVLAKQEITINAVAPGFIETQMTAAIPFTIREAGRRMNAMSQGGQPVDVAEAIAFFASPAAQGVTGNIMRVCGLSLIGA